VLNTTLSNISTTEGLSGLMLESYCLTDRSYQVSKRSVTTCVPFFAHPAKGHVSHCHHLGMIYQSSNSFPALTLTAPTEISIKIGCNWPRTFPKLFMPEAQTTTYAN
jgi:hypothetical protein